MKKILVTGALGQIGSELVVELRKKYGNNNVVASDVRENIPDSIKDGPFEKLDILDRNRLDEIIAKYEIDSIFHLAALLSATGEKDPLLCWRINMDGTMNILESSVKNKIEKVFVPSSIAVWGDEIPLENTPQLSNLRPTTMYGVTKVSGELLGNYYFKKYGLDVRGIRYPGIISSETLPGGGTTDYAVEIFYEAIHNGSYNCFLKEDATLPMMFMEDCVRGTIELMEADVDKLSFHSDYNLAAISFSPKELAKEIKKHIPEFEITYEPDYRQEIADSWPRSIDDSAARKDWDWNHKYDLELMTKTMIKRLKSKIGK